MKANELRIGNIVLYAGQQCKVLGIDEDTSIYLERCGWVAVEDLQPIPINKNILLSFGIKEQTNIHYKIEDLLLLKYSDKYVVSINLQEIATIKYVHELQNLFFALKGEELKIK